jgi:hypothetical protein
VHSRLAAAAGGAAILFGYNRLPSTFVIARHTPAAGGQAEWMVEANRRLWACACTT